MIKALAHSHLTLYSRKSWHKKGYWRWIDRSYFYTVVTQSCKPLKFYSYKYTVKLIECSLLNFSGYFLTLCIVKLLILLVTRISTIKLADDTWLPQLSFVVSLSIPELPVGHIYVQYSSTTGHETFNLCYNFRS